MAHAGVHLDPVVFAPPRVACRRSCPLRRWTTGYSPPRPPAWSFPCSVSSSRYNPSVIERLLPFIATQAAVWVRAQRERHRPAGIPLEPELRERLAAYFAAETLERARVTEVDGIGD